VNQPGSSEPGISQDMKMSNRDYKVMREHEGDRFYKTGETRTMSEADAKHLVVLGVLSPIEGGKSEPAPKNKAEGAADNNKSDYEDMTVAELKEYAEKNGIDLGDATKKADIIAAIELSDESNT
jgi:hypothetical protein